ncbi:DUF4398 domain-containing protein [Geomonas sp. RF6]|uniref:DUF4398 domain-containing protein n=1 Tax=Geomonas sp. RF6 TaxID=2897342 RepID=UPI001E467D2D|nr:DUF4398 domain-containing protein [Geomonas sp. RF6]UFS70495.1 DUF4398 domain-containing protein [Geomonas sp. RF6]
MHSNNIKLHGLPAALALLGLALLGGCAATSEMATGRIDAADKAVAVASEGNTRTVAPAELRMAQDKLNAAKAAQINQDYDGAMRLANEAAADADYARARATTARTQQMVKDVQESVSMLRKEIQNSQSP